jgi:hypothetical protein
MVEEIAMADLELEVPFRDVELRLRLFGRTVVAGSAPKVFELLLPEYGRERACALMKRHCSAEALPSVRQCSLPLADDQTYLGVIYDSRYLNYASIP